jgi:hypothetical protein
MSGKPGENFWWVAPVTSQADIAFTRMMRGLPREVITCYHSNPKKIVFHHIDTTVWFKSGDHEDTLYGEDVHGCVIDEASRLKAGAWYAIRTTLTATRERIKHQEREDCRLQRPAPTAPRAGRLSDCRLHRVAGQNGHGWKAW